ncbi:MAG: DUF302 domain-containing protein [Acidobacteria bacterium]|nr:MAG: DUF302 domain-containing protein [Acidobacteriota bacterium]
MLYQVKSTKPIAQIGRDLEAAAQRNKFGVMAVHDLKAKMQEKGVDFASECMIYEVCNPQQAKNVLDVNPQISTALPCRVSVYPDPSGGVTLATMRPTAMIEMFHTPGLQAVAQEVEAAIIQIMDEAAHG